MLLRSRVAAVLASLLVVGLAPPAEASEVDADFHSFSNEDYHQLIETSWELLPSLGPAGNPGWITGSPAGDERIWDLAFAAGYQMTPRAATEDLVWNDGYPMQILASNAWDDLQSAARSAGHRIVVTSGYRSISAQRTTFTRKLYSTSDWAIRSRLDYSAPPGASRHHTGYTLDIIESGGTIAGFSASAAFRWLSADNYFNAKRFGFVPSYPPDTPGHGPKPEPWEYVYVGLDLLAGDVAFIDVRPSDFFSRSVAWMAENEYTVGCEPYRFCPDVPATRGEVAVFIKRLLGSLLGPADPVPFEDADGHIFESAIGWLGGHRITVGCNPPDSDRFCPDRPITRGEISAWIKRALGGVLETEPGPVPEFIDSTDSLFANSIAWLAATGITTGCNPPDNTEYCPDEMITRGEIAVFLKRVSDRLP